MDKKLGSVVLVFSLMLQMVLADIAFNMRGDLKVEDLENLGLKCHPGRTVIRIEEKPQISQMNLDSSSEDDVYRRTHMNFANIVEKDETCNICACSTEGKEKLCTKRPAANVNECLRMARLLKEFQYEPFSHERTLAYRTRRDMIWHDDEIPYHATDRCRRGRSYYTNNEEVDTLGDQTNMTSLLNYGNRSFCFYCVCGIDGAKADCFNRDQWFCEYFRTINAPGAARARYAFLLGQDRPTYFRTLSYRLRRVMDHGMYDLIDNGGDTLCCDHPSGHRRNMHSMVRHKIIQNMRKRVPKENLLSGSPGGDYVDFVVNNDK